MGNYLNAELYKILHRRTYTLGMLGFLLGGEALLLILLRTAGFSNATTFNDVLGVLPMTLSMGLYLVPAVVDIVFSDQYKQNTLKNEVSYGLFRGRIYLGKLLAACMTAVALCTLVLAFYVALATVMFPVREPALAAEQFSQFGASLAAALPVWLGGLGLIHMLLFMSKGSTSATVIYIVILSGGNILDLMQMFLPRLAPVLSTVKYWLVATPMDGVLRGVGDLSYAWMVGMLWLVVSTLIGLIYFCKREIN